MKSLLLLLIGTVIASAAPVLRGGEAAGAAKRVDELLAQGLQKHNLKANPPVSDEVFLRRAYLTVVGRIPSLDEAKAFYTCQDPRKRSTLIDSLLASDGYVHHFFNYWADVLRAQSQGVGDSTTAQNYLNYLRQSLKDNKPWDQLARELVSGRGPCFDNGAIGYYMRDRGMPLDNLSNTTRIFLGTRMECAQCHDHPFDKWSQKQFYEMAAFTHNMTATSYRSPGAEEVQKMIRQDKALDTETRDLMRQALTEVTRPLRDTLVVENKNSLRLPADYKYSDAKPKDVVQASVMFGKAATLSKDTDTIGTFSQWLASPDNPRFTTVIVNRLWKNVFGRGLIEPLDELMDETVPSNPELEVFLEKEMVRLHYDMKAFLKILLSTDAFARESIKEVGLGEPSYFQGPVFRRMTAEQAWDSLITLVNPLPDQINWSSRERERRELENRRRLAELLDKTEAPLLFEAARQVAVAMKEQNKGFDQLRKDLDEARAKDDKERAREIQRKLNESQRIMRQEVSKAFYAAAQRSNNQQVKEKLAEIGAGGPMDMAMMSLMESPRVDMNEMPIPADMTNRMRSDEQTLGLKDPKSIKSYESYEKSLHQSWCRAAELQSPAPRGHFLREFGQSDRDVIENSSDEASVPQALTLMNAPLLSQISGGWSVLSVNMRKAKNDDERLNTIYLSIFSRLPSDKERNVMRQRIESYASDKNLWEDLALSALSTQRFIFIQ